MDVIKPKIGLEEFTQILEPVLLEYYDTGNTEEVVVSSYRKLKILQLFYNFKCKEGGVQVLKILFLQRTINELDVNAKVSQILEIAISKALDHKAAHREMTSVLISDLYGKILSSQDVMSGFDAILDNLAELTIDTPEAPSVRSS